MCVMHVFTHLGGGAGSISSNSWSRPSLQRRPLELLKLWALRAAGTEGGALWGCVLPGGSSVCVCADMHAAAGAGSCLRACGLGVGEAPP